MRPRELALLLLGSDELRPRPRMRSQQPDALGLALKRRLLERLVELDPEPANLDAALAHLIDELGPPPGPIRALAIGFRDDWQGLPCNPEWLQHLREQASEDPERGDGGGRRVPS
jgi:hypothetical protein